ncbi:MAG: hypothetical protein K8R37_03920 [Bacteroidales bacterium]|nr:hypothetical protein [Bacteroidales bacterium]
MKKGIDLDKKKYTIYTNNLAGINEIRTLNPSQCKLQERHFNLIGGQPLSKYRATTGDSTQKFLDTIWNVQNSDKVNKVEDQREILTLSILTSNWFLVGEDYQTISICARGEGHFEFKQSVINNSDQIILISPLGKILPLDNENELNCLLPDTEEKDYQALKLPTESKDKIFLLTTYRSNAIYSPLMQVSTKLSDLKDPTRHLCPKNYSFTKSSPRFNPEGDRYKIVVTELPHEYIRDNFNEVYRFNL